MKIFLNSALVSHLKAAREWLPQLPSLSTFEDWLHAREQALGECFVFIEGVLHAPRGNIRVSPNGQIDLVVAFRDRALSIEIKQHRSSKPQLFERLVEQIDGQSNWLNALFEENHLSIRAVQKAALFPNFSDAGLEDAERRLRGLGRTDILVVGSSAGKRGWNEDLARLLNNRPTEPRGDLRSFFHSSFDQGYGYLKEFGSLSKAIGFLATVSDSAIVKQPEGYVPDLRESERKSALDQLRRLKAVLLSGAPGMGKSILAREIINHLGLPVIAITNATSSTEKLAQQLAKASDGLTHDHEPWEILLDELIQRPCIFWIQHSTETSNRAIVDLIQRISGHQRSVDLPSRWIIETHSTMSGLDQVMCPLRPLDNRALAQILERSVSGFGDLAFETAISKSGGNPRDALAIWQSGGEYDIAAGGNAPLAGLRDWKRKLASGMAQALLHSPLGIPTALLKKWGTLIVPERIASEMDQGTENLLALFQQNCLLDRVQLSAGAFDGQLEEIIPPEIRFDLVLATNSYQLRLVAQELRLGDDAKPIKEKWLNFLIEESGGSSLLKATASLLSGEVDEFYMSPFRWSSISPIVDWLESEPGIDWSGAGAYLLKIIRISARRLSPSVAELNGQLGPVPKNVRVCQIAFDILSRRSLLSRSNENNGHFEDWLTEVWSLPFETARVELLSRAADWLANPSGGEKAGEAWAILCRLLEDKEVSGDTRQFAVLKALEFLNRQKILRFALSDEAANLWRERLASELMAYSIQSQDLQMLCHAIFYFARANEYAEARRTPETVIAWERALLFAEQFTASRRLKVRVLLTLSSIHRHAIRENPISWTDFVTHATPAIDYAKRALRYSRSQGTVLHQLNALAYMGRVCITGMRFGDIPQWQDWFSRPANEVLDIILVELPRVAQNVAGERESEIYRNLRLTFPSVQFAVSVARETRHTPEHIRLLQKGFQDVADILDTVVHAGREPQQRTSVKKFLNQEIDRLRRFVRFAKITTTSEPGRLDDIRPILISILAVTKPAFGLAVGDSKSAWGKLCVALDQPLPRR